jgi:hypothetical protein
MVAVAVVMNYDYSESISDDVMKTDRTKVVELSVKR